MDFTNDPSMTFSISNTEVRHLLKNINSNKSPGPVGIHGKILKNCAISLAYPLSQLYNNSYRTGRLPDEW